MSQARQHIIRRRNILKVIKDQQARALRLPREFGHCHLRRLIVGPVWKSHFAAAQRDFRINGGWVRQAEPMDSAKIFSIPISKLYRELSLAESAHAGDGLGDDGAGFGLS